MSPACHGRQHLMSALALQQRQRFVRLRIDNKSHDSSATPWAGDGHLGMMLARARRHVYEHGCERPWPLATRIGMNGSKLRISCRGRASRSIPTFRNREPANSVCVGEGGSAPEGLPLVASRGCEYLALSHTWSHVRASSVQLLAASRGKVQHTHQVPIHI